MKNILYLCLSFSLLLFCVYTNAQAQEVLLLEDVLRFTGANNLTIKEYQLKKELANAEHQLNKQWWIPDLYAGISLHQLNGLAMNSDGRFFTDVNRQNVWGGLGANFEFDFNEGLNQSGASKERSKAMLYESIAAKNNEILSAIQLYFELQASHIKLEAMQKLLEQSDTIVQQLEVQNIAGITYKSEVLLAKSNLSHYKVKIKKQEAAQQTHLLKLQELLNRPDSTLQTFIVDTTFMPIELVNINDIGGDFYTKRPEYQGIEKEMMALKKERNTVSKGLLLPTLYLGVTGGAFGDFFTPTDQDFQEIDPLHSSVQFNGALTWELPLGNILGSGEKEIFDQHLLMQENRLYQLQVSTNTEVQTALVQTKIAKEQIEVAKEGLDFAKEALRQSIERQKLRTAKPYEVFQAQEYFLRSQLDYIESIKLYNQSQYSLYVALGNNL